ncbi:hypothetical protein RHGRI_014076 [Rhododendron griersonianum]|uniref:DUF8040 domain-containing protein n=1 Tax=Rhododendron griersonianum TaxID=479676 RepID=A0AAV6K8C0_9ERIC|nr:hypothetical protein RHGRI_014076 [Rhododendron griersonianum]
MNLGGGNCVSPRKHTPQPSQTHRSPSTKDRVKWTSPLTRHFLQAILDEIQEESIGTAQFTNLAWQSPMDPSYWLFGNSNEYYGSRLLNNSEYGTSQVNPYGSSFDTGAWGHQYSIMGKGSTSQYNYTMLLTQRVGNVSLQEISDMPNVLGGGGCHAPPTDPFQPRSDKPSELFVEEGSDSSDIEIDEDTIIQVSLIDESEMFAYFKSMMDDIVPEKKKKRIPYHTSKQTGLEWVRSMSTCKNPARCLANFSMNRHTYMSLCTELTMKYRWVTKRERPNTVCEIKALAMFVCVLRGMDLQQVYEQCNRGKSIVSHNCNKILICLDNFATDQLKPEEDH